MVGSLLPALVQLMTLSPCRAAELMETGQKVQTKLQVLQADLARKVDTIWDQRLPKEGHDDLLPSAALPSSTVAPAPAPPLVPRPSISDSLAWKLSLI